MTPAIEALEALARRAVACRGWRWMQGMLIADNGAGVRFLWEDDRYLHGMAAEASGLWMRMNKDRERLPDLTDPATLGCLLALYDETRAVLVVPDPVYTMTAAYGLHHPMTIASIVAALEAAP